MKCVGEFFLFSDKVLLTDFMDYSFNMVWKGVLMLQFGMYVDQVTSVPANCSNQLSEECFEDAVIG